MTYIYTFSRLYICIYIVIYTLEHSPSCIYIYIYIYMQHKTLKYHTQATSTVGSYSQHGITIQQSPPEVIVGFYQEIPRYYKYSLDIAALPTAINKSNPKELHEISPGISTYTQDWADRTMLSSLFYWL